ncbi:MAG: PAS domain S-box protein [Flavobacterium sp.]|nr:PAS domain S-box protein [Flavobacterium sp.]
MDKSNISNNLLYTQKHFDLLINLNKLSFKQSCPLNEIFDLITESAVEGLNIDRASFWKIEGEKLVCENLYDRNENAHIRQNDLWKRDFPIYFKALSDGIAIVADDAKTNQYTSEFKDNYLIPLGITDMLDLPIRENGKVIGVLCCEHKDNPRTWSSSDFAFARSIADLLTLLIEQNKSKVIQEKLIESERKISLITENSKDGFVVIENRKITYVSPSYCNTLGYNSNELLNLDVNKIFENIHPDDIEKVKSITEEMLLKKEKTFTIEFRIKTKSGKYIWREDTSCIIYNPDGSYSKYSVISRDLSDLKAAFEKNEKLYEITKKQNEKLVDFTYIVSHNIRSNSCNISMILDLIEDCNDESEKQNYFELLKDSNDKLSETLYFLNETINIQNNHENLRIDLNVKTEIAKIIKNQNGLLNNDSIVFEINIDDNLQIKTIPAYFESIIFNLISNSVKYRSENKKTIIKIEAHRLDNTYVIKIKDNGLGINLQKNGDKLFGMYKTFHGNDDAVGLGLYMTKNHVEYLNGKIEVESEENIGTKFKITFYE